jgi:hypothetical protein
MSKQTDLINIPDAITVSGSNVGIGETVPLGKLHVKTADSGATVDVGADELVIEGSGNAGMSILSGASNTGSIYFGDSGTNWDGYIAYSQNSRSMTFGTAAGGGSMTLDSSGRATTPSQPSFLVRRNGDQTGYNPNNYAHSVIFNQEEYDIGNNVSTTTGLFTAPVDGVYIFFASAFATSNTLNQAWFTLNGGRGAASDFVKSSADSFVNCSIVFKLSANDTVGYHPYGSGTNSTIRGNINHTWFRGHLIG